MAIPGIESIKGSGGSSRARQSYVPPSDEADEADDTGQAQNGQANIIAMVEQLIMSILKDLMAQMRGSQQGGGSQGGHSPVSGAGGAKGAHGGRGAHGGHGPGGGHGPAGAHGPGGAHGGSGGHAPAAAKAQDTHKPSGSSGGASGGGGNTALLNEINRVRREAGLGELKEKSNLDGAAAKNDAANVSTGQLDHHNGLIDGAMGEITAGNSGGESAASAVDQWMNSPHHREIMMNPGYTEVGVSINGDYATADFS